MSLVSTTTALCRSAGTRLVSSTSVVQEAATLASHPQQTARPTHNKRDEATTLSHRRPIYVAATSKNIGKTSTCLALMSGLQKRFDRVGFIKPVGQQSVPVQQDDTHGGDGSSTILQVDKDAALIMHHFGLHHISCRDASPVLIPSGYTKDYLDGKITAREQKDNIWQAFQRIDTASDVVLCEGTGHCAVGSIIQACNAQVASWLNAKMVLVANGGLGNTFDELELNKSLCDKFGVEVAGVIINKVQAPKLEQTRHYLELALNRWNVPLLACIPDRPFLGSPALADLERLFPGASLVSGQAHRLRHYRPQDLHLVATSLNLFLKNVRKNPPRTLYLCHASRNDILLGFLMESQQRRHEQEWQAGMIVTGCEEYPISTQVMEIVKSMPSSAPPVLMAPQPTRDVMERIYNYTPKLNLEDGHRVSTAVEHYEPYIDFDQLLERVGVDHRRGSSSLDMNEKLNL